MTSNAPAMPNNLSFVPDDVLWVMERYRQAGFDVWLVGGALRDRFLGLDPKDWDLATSAGVEDAFRLFPKVIPVGARHGTVQVHSRLRDIEVTTVPGSGAEGILADLGRRDFTVNALALTYPEGTLLDPHCGREDLMAGVLRAVGDPRARFREDPLRALRAGRFVSVYGFRIHDATLSALHDESEGLDRVAQERIRDEMTKMLLGAEVMEAFEKMKICGVLSHVLPELLQEWMGGCLMEHQYDLYQHTLRTVHLSPPCLRVRLAALFHLIARPLTGKHAEKEVPGVAHETIAGADEERAVAVGKTRNTQGGEGAEGARELCLLCTASARLATEIMTRWRMSHREIREVTMLVENQVPRTTGSWSDGEVRRFMARVAPDLLEDVLKLARAQRLAFPEPEAYLEQLEALESRIGRLIEQRPPLRINDLAVDGDMVMKILGIGPGPRVGEALRKLHREVLENPSLNHPEALINLLEEEYRAKPSTD